MTPTMIPQADRGRHRCSFPVMPPIPAPEPLTPEETLRRKAASMSWSRSCEADRMIEADSHVVLWHSADLTQFRIRRRRNAPPGPPYLVDLLAVTCTCPDTKTLAGVNAELEAIGDAGSLTCKHCSVCWRLANEPGNLARAMMPTPDCVSVPGPVDTRRKGDFSA